MTYTPPSKYWLLPSRPWDHWLQVRESSASWVLCWQEHSGGNSWFLPLYSRILLGFFSCICLSSTLHPILLYMICFTVTQILIFWSCFLFSPKTSFTQLSILNSFKDQQPNTDECLCPWSPQYSPALILSQFLLSYHTCTNAHSVSLQGSK